MKRLTREQAAVIGAYTGIICGPFGDIQEYAKRILKRPIWTHEFASQELRDTLKQAATEDFRALCAEGLPLRALLQEET